MVYEEERRKEVVFYSTRSRGGGNMVRQRQYSGVTVAVRLFGGFCGSITSNKRR